jgi:hypothetical protein
MLNRLGIAGLLALWLAGCPSSNPQEGAVLAVITLEPKARATCLVLEASEPGGKVLKDLRLEAGDAREYKVAVFRGALPAEVGLRARSYFGTACQEPLVAMAASDEQRTGFPVGSVGHIALTIAAPSAADDQDADGFAAIAKGGLDCNDADPTINPAATESCNALVDLNCNGLMGCADPVCTSQTCAKPPAALAFLSPPQTLAAGACSAEVTLEVRSVSGLAATVAADTRVGLTATPSAGFAFFADSTCATAADAVTVPAHSSRATFFMKGTAAGDVVVTGAALGLAQVTQTHTVTAAEAAKLEFVTPGRTIAAGGCSSALTLESQDAFGNGAVQPSYVTVILAASPSVGASFFHQPDCTGLASTFGIAAGQKRATFYFSSTTAGTVTVSASSPPMLPAQQDQTVTGAAPVVLAFATPPRTAEAGVCSSVVTLETRDSLGNASPVAAPVTASLSGTPSGSYTFYTDAACTGSAVTQVTVAAGQSTASLYFKGSAVAVGALSANAGGFPPISQPATVLPGQARALAFVTGVQGVQAAQCSGIVTVRSQDTSGNAATVLATTQLDLSANPFAGFTFYSDAGCTTAVTFVNLTTASGPTASFYFKASNPVQHTLTVQGSGLGSVQQVENVGVGTAAKLAFTTAAQTMTAGACSGLVTVQSQDAAGNAANVASSTTVNLVAAPSTSFLFYSDNTCTTAITQVTVAVSSAGFYFRGTRAGSVSVTASTAGSLSPATQGQTLNRDIPSKLVFTSAVQSLTARACSALASLEVRDQFDNVTPVVAGATVTLTAVPPAGFAFFSDSSCTAAVTTAAVAPNGSTASFYFKGTAAGSVVVTATSPGLGSVPQTESINPGPPASLEFATTAKTVTVGACSTLVTLRVVDLDGNPTAALTGSPIAVNVTQAPAGVTLYAGPGCTNAATTFNIAAGTGAVSFYFRAGVLAQDVVLTAASSLPSVLQTETLAPAAPTVLAFTTAAQTILTGACSAIATVQAHDVNGNPSPVAAGSTVALTASPSTGLAFYSDSDSGCVTPVTSTSIAVNGTSASFYFKGTAPLSTNLTATAGGVGATGQAATINVASPTKMAFLTGPFHQTVNLCSPALTLETRDASGNVSPVSALTTLNLAVVATPTFGLFSDSNCSTSASNVTVAAGASTSSPFYFKGTAFALAVVVNVTDPGLTLAAVSQTESVSAGPTYLIYAQGTLPQTLHAGVCSAAVVVETRDDTGELTNVAAATPVTIAPQTGMTFYSDSTCTAVVLGPTIAAGASSATFYYKGITGGSYSLNASAAGPWSASLGSNVIIPAVQTGICTIAAGSTSVNCPIPTALSNKNNSFFVFQATTSGDTAPNRSYVRCTLQDTLTIVCTRKSNSAGASPAVIEWQTADLPGITVEHLTPACVSDTTSVTISAVAAMDKTFVLHSFESNNGTRSGNDFHAVRLVDSTHVEIRQSLTGGGSCGNNAIHSLQVVQMPTVTVTRGGVAMASGNLTVAPTVAGGALANSALLYSWRTTPSNNDQCRRMVRGEVTSSTGLTFSRGNGSAACNGDTLDDIQWERIEFPSAVQPFGTIMLNAIGIGGGIPAPVDTTRTLIFAGGQITSGQAAGEGSLTGSSVLGAMVARQRLVGPMLFGLTRDDTSGSARFTSFVVQLDP